MKQKTLIDLAKQLNAIDLTNCQNIVDIIGRETGMSIVQVSSGVYGMNAALVKGNVTGRLYVVTKRCSNLFVVI